MLLSLVATVLVQAPVTFQHGVLTPPLVGSPGEAALRYAQTQRDTWGLDPRSNLVVGNRFSTRFGGTVQLVQQVDGLEVNGGRVMITFDSQQRVVRVSSSLKAFSTVRLQTQLTPAQAVAIASREIEGAWLRQDGLAYGGATRRAFVVHGELHVGYLTFVPTLKASDSWHVAVDGTDGSVLWVENRVHASRVAEVYPSSPGGLQAGIGVTPVVSAELLHLAEDAGFLTGERIRALNCCPTVNCSLDAGPARAQGMLQGQGGTVSFDVAMCDQRQRATNDPALHSSGNYVYEPVDQPNTITPSIYQPADYDEFAEVMAYYHVTKAYDAMRALSMGPLVGSFSPFTMRQAGPDLPAVWVNVSDANLSGAMPNAQGVYVSDTLSRTENAMFLARENMEYLLLPPQVLASDALVIYQGRSVDFAYDGPVLWHEFGHGLIHSTSDWQVTVSFDARSANNESSALHEGIADLIAAMTGNDPLVGAYVGPRITAGASGIRSVENNDRCPDSLWGESHQDGLLFTGAVWEARTHLFQGIDHGATFDAALYAAIVSFPPDVNFQSAARIISDSVARAFPEMTDAQLKMEAAFDDRGATHCSKVLDVTNSLNQPRQYFNIVGTDFAAVADGSVVPGPYQFKIHAPRGAKNVKVTAPYRTGGPGGGTVRLEVLASANQPITFTRTGNALSNDAQARIVPTGASGTMTATLPIEVPCGGDLYFALGNTSRRDRALQQLSYSFEEAEGCPTVVDAGVEDAGVMTPPINLPAASEDLGGPVQGCGCSTTNPSWLALGLLALMRWSRSTRKKC